MIVSSKHGDIATITVDAEDVSNRCFFADEDASIAYCYVREPAPGGGTRIQLDANGEPVVVKKTGKVVITPLTPQRPNHFAAGI